MSSQDPVSAPARRRSLRLLNKEQAQTENTKQTDAHASNHSKKDNHKDQNTRNHRSSRSRKSGRLRKSSKSHSKTNKTKNTNDLYAACFNNKYQQSQTHTSQEDWDKAKYKLCPVSVCI